MLILMLIYVSELCPCAVCIAVKNKRTFTVFVILVQDCLMSSVTCLKWCDIYLPTHHIYTTPRLLDCFPKWDRGLKILSIKLPYLRNIFNKTYLSNTYFMSIFYFMPYDDIKRQQQVVKHHRWVEINWISMFSLKPFLIILNIQKHSKGLSKYIFNGVDKCTMNMINTLNLFQEILLNVFSTLFRS